MDIKEQLKLLNNNERKILDFLISSKGARLRIRDITRNINLSRQIVSPALHVLEVGFLVTREEEIFFKVTGRTIRYYVEFSSK